MARLLRNGLRARGRPRRRDAALILLAATTDRVKLSALQAALAVAQLRFEVFDAAAGSMWGSAIPCRLMVEAADLASARSALAAAGFRPAADGDWDLRER